MLSCFSPMFLLWFLLGRLEFAAKPLANAGFHWVRRYGRRLNTTALLALKCSAVEASGPRLDLGEKHSLVIARRAARPFNRREVGRGDRLIFAHGTSLRRERYELPVTDNRAQGRGRSTMWLLEPDSLVNIAHLSKFMFGGPWSGRLPLTTVLSVAFGGAVAVADPLQPKARPFKRHIADRERALCAGRATISPLKRSISPQDWGW